MNNFALFGTKNGFIVDEHRAAYNKIHNKYQQLSIKLSEAFEQKAKQLFKSADDIFSQAEELSASFIGEAIEEAMQMLFDLGIHDVDEKMFISKYYEPYYAWGEYFESFSEQYLDIIYTDIEMNQYYEERKNNRGRVIGGGFGFSGAVKGMAQAGLMNMASGTAHNFANNMERKASTEEMKRKKASLFKNQNTIKSLVSGVEESVFNVHYAFIDAVNDLHREISIIGTISQDEEEKAQRIMNNLKSRETSEDVEIKLLHEVLNLNPYLDDAYIYILMSYGDEDGTIQEIGEYFDIPISMYKKVMLKKERGELSYNTEEEALKSKEEFLEYAKELGIQEYEDELLVIDTILKEFDLKARTLDGIILETREEVPKAKEEKIYLDLQLDGYQKKTEEDLKELQEKLLQESFETSIIKHYYTLIEQQLRKLDLAYRTVDYVVMDTREQADLAIEEHQRLTNMMANANFEDPLDIKKLKEDIQKDFQTKLKQKYLERVSLKEMYVYKSKIKETILKHDAITHEKTMGIKKQVISLVSPFGEVNELKKIILNSISEYEVKHRKILGTIERMDKEKNENISKRFSKKALVVMLFIILGIILMSLFNLIGLGIFILLVYLYRKKKKEDIQIYQQVKQVIVESKETAKA